MYGGTRPLHDRARHYTHGVEQSVQCSAVGGGGDGAGRGGSGYAIPTYLNGFLA